MLIAALALLGAAQLAPTADAVGPRTLKKLRQAPCPPDYRPGGIKAEYSAADIDDALDDDRYHVAVDQRPVLVPPIDWHQDPIGSQTFRNALHALNWTQVLFAGYLERGQADQERALNKATAIFLDWIRNNPRNGPATAEEAWGTKRAGDRLTLITYLARVATCEGTISRSVAGELLDSAADHALYIERHRSSNNHGLFDAYALAVAAENLPFMKQAEHWRKLGVRRFESVLRGRIIDDEGIWLDHSTTYDFAVVSLLQRLLALPNTGDKSLRKLLGRMERAAAWLVEKPNGGRLQWGDSGGQRAPQEFVDAAADLDGLESKRRSGLAFVRDGDAYLATMASYFNRVHKHSDELSFGLYDAGRQVVSDTGDYERDAGAWRDFTTSAYAHSTLVVDGEPFERTDEAAYGSGIAAAGRGPSASGSDWYAIRGSNPLLASKGITHQRWFVYKPGEVLVIVDRVESSAPHSYTRYFHLGPTIDQAPRVGGGLTLSDGAWEGTLIDRSPTTSQLYTIRGRYENSPAGVPFASDPGGLQGYTSPSFENVTPRWTAAFNTGTGDEEDFVASVGLDASQTRADLVGEPTATRVALRLRTGAGPPGTQGAGLEIVRDGAELQITETP